MSPLDHYVYLFRCNKNITILSLYVDDMLLARNNLDMIRKTKSFLESTFEMDMGLVTYALGIRITRDRDAKLLYLDFENYLEKVLNRFNMANVKPISMLVSKGTILSKNMCRKDDEEIIFMENVAYAQAVERLMYAMTSIRLDICHVVGLVSI